MQRFGGGPNTMAAHYPQYPPHTQGHASGLPPPSLGGNPAFMNPNAGGMNPFTVNGNALSLAQGFGGGGGMGGVGTGLASHAAQMSFAHGAAMQQAVNNGIAEQGGRGAAKGRIREVWKHNLAEEMDTLRRLVDRYPYISMVSREWQVAECSLTSHRTQSSLE